jgi:hypothetical protein
VLNDTTLPEFVIINFEKGKVYLVMNNDGGEYAVIIKIITGDLNSGLYTGCYMPEDTLYFGFAFAEERNPEVLAVVNESGGTAPYTPTNLQAAQKKLKNLQSVDFSKAY